MKLLVMSDIHGNENALSSVLDRIRNLTMDGIILLGDLIDYGPHSNEVLEAIQRVRLPVFCNIFGNHEDAIFNEIYDRFSSDRGRSSARYTRSILSKDSWNYLENNMNNSGKFEFEVDNLRCLAVHGSLRDEYWIPINSEDDFSMYQEYDYVFSGHSHLPHFFEVCYSVHNPLMRNKKKTVFVNPGSVGQPRNLCPLAQFSIWDTKTGEITMARVPYDINKEQQAFSDKVDIFYKRRLEVGI